MLRSAEIHPSSKLRSKFRSYEKLSSVELMSNRNELLKMYSSYSQIQISEMAESLRKTFDK